MDMRHPRTPIAPALTLALVVTVLAGCGNQPSGDEPPAPGVDTRSTSPEPTPEPEPATAIPDDFPLAGRMGGPEDDPEADGRGTSRTGTGLRDLAFCGTSPLRGLGIRDRMIFDNSGGESAHTRELVLLGSPEESLLAAQTFTDLALGCDEPEGEGGMTTTTEVRESSYGPGPAATLLKTYAFDGEPGPGTTIIQVVPVGSALLVSSTYGEWPEAALEDGVAETEAALSDAVAAMAIFADGAPPATTALPAPRGIPDGFPLDTAMIEADADYTRHGPSREGAGAGEVEMCGQVVWPDTDAQDRLVTHVEGPEYHDARELLVFADSEAALETMVPIREAAQECRTMDNQVWTPLDEDTGWDSVTMGLSYDDGLGSSVFQFTRVGSAVLFATTYGEGSLQSLPDQGADVTDVTTAIAPAMCVFTADGC